MKRITKTLSLLLILSMMLTLAPAEVFASAAGISELNNTASSGISRLPGDSAQVSVTPAAMNALFPGLQGSGTDNDPIRIYSANDLMLFLMFGSNRPWLYVDLMNDITVPAGSDFSMQGQFLGVFRGNGRTITMSVPAGGKMYPLFMQMGSPATIRDFNYIQTTNTQTAYAAPSNSVPYFGAIVGVATSGAIQNCNVTMYIDNRQGNAFPTNVAFGGLIGMITPGSGTSIVSVKNCSVKITGRHDNFVPLADNMGGIAGNVGVMHTSNYKQVEILNCMVELAAFSGRSNVGGIVGSVQELGAVRNPNFIEISNCVVVSGSMSTGDIYKAGNATFISGSTNVGGIAGRMDTGTIKNCAVITQENDPVPSLYYEYMFEQYSIRASYSGVGGVVGELNKGTIENCYSTATVVAEGGIAGGIAGYLAGRDAVIRSCIALNYRIEGQTKGRVAGTEYGLLLNNRAGMTTIDKIVYTPIGSFGAYDRTLTTYRSDAKSDEPNGQEVSILRLYENRFWTDEMGWSTSSWEFRGADNRLPAPRSLPSGSALANYLVWNKTPMHLTWRKTTLVWGYPLTISPESSVYNGQPQPVTASIPADTPQGGGMVYTMNYIGYGSTAPSNAGAYTVRVSYSNPYYSGSVDRNFVIQKASRNPVGRLFLVKENLSETYSYDLSQLLPGDLVAPGNLQYKVTAVADPGGLLRNGVALSGKTFIGGDPLPLGIAAFVAGGRADLTIEITSNNYDFTSAATLTIETSEKEPLNIGGITVSDRDYEKDVSFGYGGTLSFLDSAGNPPASFDFTPVIKYSGESRAGVPYYSDNSGGGAAVGPTDAGSYTLSIEIPDSSIYVGAASYSFTIRPKLVTVRAGSYVIKYKDELPQPGYTISGFYPGDEASAFSTQPSVRLNVVNSDVPGRSDVDFSVTSVLSNMNYRVEHIKGTLDIQPGQVAPTFQLLYLSPSTIYSKDEKKVLSLTGNTLENADVITIMTPSNPSGVVLGAAEKSAACTVSTDGRLLTIDLIILEKSFSRNFTTTGNYSIHLTDSAKGYQSRTLSFSVSDNANYSRSGYGVLRIVQNANGSFDIQGFEKESDMPRVSGNQRSLIVIRGQIIEDKATGTYLVASGSFLNKVLAYSGENFTIKKESNGNISISSTGDLSWRGNKILKQGFSTSLNPGTMYDPVRTKPESKGIIISRAGGRTSLNLFTLQVEEFDIKLFEDTISVGGKLIIGSSMPAFVEGIGGAGFTLHEMLLADQQAAALPPMHFQAYVGVAEEGPVGALIGDTGFKLDLAINSLPETRPKYFGVKGEVTVAQMFYMRGHFILAWDNGIFIPEKIELFGRVDQYGLPLVPPVIVAYIQGFGGGVDGLANTVFGTYDRIPPLSVKGMGAFVDATSLLQANEVTLTVGPREISLKANDAKLFKLLKLSDFGWSFGFKPAQGGGNVPDTYFRFNGEMSTDFLSVGYIKGDVDLSASIRGRALANSSVELYDIMKKLASGRAPTTAELQILGNYLIDLIDLNGKVSGKIGIDIKVFKGEAYGSLAFSKEGKQITISGMIGVQSYLLGSELASFGLSVVYDVNNNSLDIQTLSAMISINGSGDENSFSTSYADGGDQISFSVTNIRRVAGFGLGGQDMHDLIMPLMIATPSNLTAVADIPYIIELSGIDSERPVIEVTPPDSFENFFNQFGNYAGPVLDGAGTLSILDSGRRQLTLFDDVDAVNYPVEGTVYTELEENHFSVMPIWRQVDGNDPESGYEGAFMIMGAGEWYFKSESDLTLVAYAIDPIPELKTFDVTASGGNLTPNWTYDDKGVTYVDDLYIKPILLDAEGNVVGDLVAFADKPYPALIDGDFSITLSEALASLESGEYKVEAQLFRKSFNPDKADHCLSVLTQSSTFSWNNMAAPAEVHNVQAVYAGNGSFEVSWDTVSGADGYLVEILDADGQRIDGISLIDVTADVGASSQSVIIGGGMYDVSGSELTVPDGYDPDSYDPDNDLGNVVSQGKVGLPYGKNYKINVYAYKENVFEWNNDDPTIEDPEIPLGSHLLRGIPGTCNFILQSPSLPDITVSVSNSRIVTELIDHDGDSATNDVESSFFAVQTLKPTISISATQGAAISAALPDGTPVSGPANGSLSFTYDFEEPGSYSLFVTATAPSGDISTQTVNLLLRDEGPLLIVDSGSYFGSRGIYTITGMTESGAIVTIDGTVVFPDEETGIFTYTGRTISPITEVTVTAANEAGLETVLIVEVLMTDAATLGWVELRLAGGATSLGVRQTLDLEIWGVFFDPVSGAYDIEYRLEIDRDTAVSLVSGSGVVSLSGWKVTGISEGSAVIRLTYPPPSNAIGSVNPEYMTYDLILGIVIRVLTVGNLTNSDITESGGTVTYAVSSEGFADGNYAVSLFGAPARVTADNIDIIGNSGVLTIQVGAAVQIGTYTVNIVVDGMASNKFSLAIEKGSEPYTPPITPASSGSGGGSSAALSITKINYDKKSGEDITVTLNMNGNTLLNLKNGSNTLLRGTDYTVSGNLITIKASYLAALTVGEHVILFDMSAGTDPTLTITITDTITDSLPPLSGKSWLNPFLDVKEGDWYYEAVEYVSTHGLMIGTSTNPMLFSPNTPLTRSMIVTILYRHAGSPDVSGLPNPFDDVPEDAWYADAVKWAYHNGIIAGYGDGRDGSTDNITRQDLAVILMRYAKFAGITLPMTREYKGFIDDADIASYAKGAIEAFLRSGIINGYPDGSVRPKGEATRAEVAVMLMRFLKADAGQGE